MAPKKRKTPIRHALNADSTLQTAVEDGHGAFSVAHRNLIVQEIRPAFGDSLDLDAALRTDYPQENRWDYLLGHAESRKVVGVEPHSAKSSEIGVVINKREAAKRQLMDHFKPGSRVSKWYWVASGKNQFLDTEKTKRLLDQNGIEFVGRQLLARHLPGENK
jgi:hypothetical protein